MSFIVAASMLVPSELGDAATKEVRAGFGEVIGVEIVFVLAVALLVAVVRYGADSRDGRDWRWAPHEAEGWSGRDDPAGVAACC